MSEPISGAAAGAAGFKAIGGAAGLKALGGAAGSGAVGMGLSALVVMCMTRPRNDREWVVALVSTFMSSVCGCAWVVVRYKLQQEMMADMFGLMALGGLFFACGLPGWAIVRWLFAYIAKRRDADLADVVKDVKGML